MGKGAEHDADKFKYEWHQSFNYTEDGSVHTHTHTQPKCVIT